MEFWYNLLMVQALLFLWMGGLYLLARSQKDAGYVDLGWTFGLGAAVMLLSCLLEGYAPRQILLSTMAVIWAGRLGFYIFFNRIKGQEEDARYRELRNHWGKKAEAYFLVAFLAEGFLVMLFCVPFIVLLQNPAAQWSAWEGVGLLVWVTAIVGELIADRQLASHRSNPSNRGKTCQAGLWKYSRHPNYFFEWLHWWAYVLMGVGVVNGWFTLLGPLVMFAFLFWITGIPHTERRASAHRPDYLEYQQTTSMFIPWFPKKRTS
jgi:steroid 5-alpha reductase family enzyme